MLKYEQLSIAKQLRKDNVRTHEDLLEAYPSLEKEDILACLEYAGALAEEQVTPLESLPGVT